jgi:hypothetical protein
VRLFFTLFIAMSCGSCWAAEPSICYGADFAEIRALSDLPPVVARLLGVDTKGAEGIADPGAPFSSTDVTVDELPHRRFSVAAVSTNCVLVAVERGANGYSVELWFFLRNGADWQRGIYGFLSPVLPRSLDELLTNAEYQFGDLYAHNGWSTRLSDFAVVQNDAEAVRWYRRAADQGLANAQLALGLMYAKGRGVEVSRVAAFALLKISNQPAASKYQGEIMALMSSKEAGSAYALYKDMVREKTLPGRISVALDRYLANATVSEEPRGEKVQ